MILCLANLNEILCGKHSKLNECPREKRSCSIYEVLHSQSRAQFFSKKCRWKNTKTCQMSSISELWAALSFFPNWRSKNGPSAGMVSIPILVINSNHGANGPWDAHQWWPIAAGTNERPRLMAGMRWFYYQYMNKSYLMQQAKTRPLQFLNGLGPKLWNELRKPKMKLRWWECKWMPTGIRFQTYQKTPLMLSLSGGNSRSDEAVPLLHEKNNISDAWAFSIHRLGIIIVFFYEIKKVGQNAWMVFWILLAIITPNRSMDLSLIKYNLRTKMLEKILQSNRYNTAGEMPSPVVSELNLSAKFCDPTSPSQTLKCWCYDSRSDFAVSGLV